MFWFWKKDEKKSFSMFDEEDLSKRPNEWTLKRFEKDIEEYPKVESKWFSMFHEG